MKVTAAAAPSAPDRLWEATAADVVRVVVAVETYSLVNVRIAAAAALLFPSATAPDATPHRGAPPSAATAVEAVEVFTDGIVLLSGVAGVVEDVIGAAAALLREDGGASCTARTSPSARTNSAVFPPPLPPTAAAGEDEKKLPFRLPAASDHSAGDR